MPTNTDRRDTLMRVKDVALELDQSKSAIYRKIAAGEIPSVRLGSTSRSPLRVPADALEEWLYHSRALEEEA